MITMRQAEERALEFMYSEDPDHEHEVAGTVLHSDYGYVVDVLQVLWRDFPDEENCGFVILVPASGTEPPRKLCAIERGYTF